MDRLLQRIDHLVYATTDLESSVTEIEERFGVRAASGGQHPGRGTRNALMALSPWSYLEIVGPDPAQPTPAAPRWFGIDSITRPCLVTWAAKGNGLYALAEQAAHHGVPLGPVVSGSRRAADGAVLQWQCTDPATVVGDGLVPFFIDWGDTPHPVTSAPGSVSLVALRGQHPEPAAIERYLSTLGIDLPLTRGPRPALLAILRAPRGLVVLT